jgi:hypothetical protein
LRPHFDYAENFVADMVAEAWILKLGNQISSNRKHALLLETLTKKKTESKKVRIK